MKRMVPILSISGSDSTGGAGIQGDIKTITALGGYALTVLTSVAVQNLQGIQSKYPLPCPLVMEQMSSVLGDLKPCAVKIGMLGNTETALAVAKELQETDNIVYAPSISTSYGAKLEDYDGSSMEICQERLFPMAKVVVLKVHDVELLFGISIGSNEDIVKAAGELQKCRKARNVFIYGGFSPSSKGLVSTRTNVLVTEDGDVEYFTLNAADYWKTHGLGSTISSAIAVFLGKGLSVSDAVSAAHEYLRSLVLLSIELVGGHRATLLNRIQSQQDITDRKVELYNRFMELVATHYRNQHNVRFYSDTIYITPRYLAQITQRLSGKSPKRLIDEYILHEAVREITSTKKPIQVIAYELGFATQAQFTKFLKKYKGESPLRLRR